MLAYCISTLRRQRRLAVRSPPVAAGRRARELVATPASQLFASGATAPWQVWRDPDGNEFCRTTDAASSPPDPAAADR